MHGIIGVPLAEGKTVGPAQDIVFLRIKLSSNKMVSIFPVDKLQKYKDKFDDIF